MTRKRPKLPVSEVQVWISLDEAGAPEFDNTCDDVGGFRYLAAYTKEEDAQARHDHIAEVAIRVLRRHRKSWSVEP